MLKVSLCAALAAIGLAATVPARAEPVRLAQATAGRFVPPYEVVAIARSLRLYPIGRPVRRGRNYYFSAIDRDDDDVRVVIDARSGEVLSIRPELRSARVDDPPYPRWRRRYGPWEDGYVPEWGEVPSPLGALRTRTPPGLSGPRVIYAPAEPIAHPPLPRARPDQMASTGNVAVPDVVATPPTIAPQTDAVAKASAPPVGLTPGAGSETASEVPAREVPATEADAVAKASEPPAVAVGDSSQKSAEVTAKEVPASQTEEVAKASKPSVPAVTPPF